jgi:hypothetical protein
MGKRLRYSLIFLMLGILFLPMLQQLLGIWREAPLFGIGDEAPKPKLTLQNWLETGYQDSMANYVNRNAAFHNSLVRLNNQLSYSLFRTAQANGVIIGKENCLYDRVHIDSYTGKDFLGEARIHQKIKLVAQLRDLLKKKGIELLVVMVPGKGTALPEYLPKGTPEAGVNTNYKSFAKLLDSLQMPYLDLIKWYHAQKAVSKYPLYPTGGNHWSEYCGTIAADTLLGFLEKFTGKELPRFEVKQVHYPLPASPIDDDINLGMNLVFHHQAPMMAYPELVWNDKPKKLHVLTIGDSFYFKMFTDFSGEAFESSHFWFYFREFHINGQRQTFRRHELDLRLEIESQDVVMLYMADPHLTDIGFGFVEETLKAYHDPAWRRPRINRIRQDIQKDPAWMQKIADKAAAAGVPVDTMLERDAIWVLENSRIR